MSNLFHLREMLDNKYFTSLVEEKDYENITSLKDYIDFSNYVVINKNLTTQEKTYVFGMVGSPTIFGNFKKIDSRIFDRIHLYLSEFDSNDLTQTKSELFFFDSTVIENSYESVRFVRDCIKRFFDYYYSYDEKSIEKSFDIFDGDTANFIDAIRINKLEKFNSYHCYEKGLNEEFSNADRNKKVLKDLLLLKCEDEQKIDELISKLNKLISNKNIRLTYEIGHNKDGIQNKVKLLLMPFYRETFAQSIQETIENLYESELIKEPQRNDLKDWEDHTNRRLSHFSLDLNYENNSFDISVVAHYGIYLREKFIVPIYRDRYDDNFNS